jgi:hypothetical protein
MKTASETQDGHSHYLAFFTERESGGLQQAVCGAWISFDRHAVLATCPQCEAWFKGLEAVPTRDQATV